MIDLTWLNGIPHVLSEPQPSVWNGVVRTDKDERLVTRDSVMTTKARKATAEEVQQWRTQG